jgi:DNA-binding response OmpR family regulator
MLPAGFEEAVADCESAQLAELGAGEHVLIVEDTDSVRMFVNEILTDAGYRCTQAADIHTALALLEQDTSIDLLLTDVGMPDMNGRELAHISRGWRPELPVLFMTGYAENALNRQSFLGEGMDMIVKPFNLAEFLDKVRSMLDRAAH